VHALTPRSRILFHKGRHGTFAHFESDNCIGRSLKIYGEWGEDEIGVLKTYVRGGSTVIDVGANVGTHSLPLAKLVGADGLVISIEAQPEIFWLLSYNVVANGFTGRIQPTQMLAGDHIGVVPYFGQTFVENLGARSFIDEANSPPTSGHFHLAMATLDSLPVQNCSLIKIDVEGMELAVLSGAGNLLERERPVVYFEHASGRADVISALHSYLRQFGYRLFWHIANPYNSNNINAFVGNIFEGVMETNVLCVADDRLPAGLVEMTDPGVPAPRTPDAIALAGAAVTSWR